MMPIRPLPVESDHRQGGLDGRVPPQDPQVDELPGGGFRELVDVVYGMVGDAGDEVATDQAGRVGRCARQRLGDDGTPLVDGRTLTGFSNIEEDYGDRATGVRIMPWRAEDALRERGANYISAGLFKPFTVRDGRLITGQQQYSSRRVAQEVIAALGV